MARLLQHSGISYTHLSVETPAHYKLQPSQPHWTLPRGVLQRNAGLAWIHNHLDADPHSGGVVYFADDDNTYDLRLFEEVCQLLSQDMLQFLQDSASLYICNKVGGGLIYNDS